MLGARRLVIPGLVAGVIAGLLVSVREIMVAATWGTVAHPLRALQDGALVVGAYVLVGLTVGLVTGLLVAMLGNLSSVTWRPHGRWKLAVGAIAAIIVLISARGERDWWTLAAELLVLSTALLAMMWEPEEDAPVVRPALVSSCAGACVSVGVFFAGGSVLNDISAMWMRAPGYVLAAVVAAAVGWGAAVAVGRVLEALAMRVGGRRSVSWLLSAVVAVTAVLAIGALARPSLLQQRLATMPAEVSGTAERPNVILISVDTLRADWVGYADGPVRTPNVDALAEQSCVFERAYAVAPWTRPSFAAFFGGVYPHEMGVARIRGYDVEGAEAVPYRWREDRLLLAEVLNAAGYGTAAVVTNGNLTEEAAADQGFDFFYNCAFSKIPGGLTHLARRAAGIASAPASDSERADTVSGTANAVIPRVRRPVLLWLHYMDPHWPYDPPDIAAGERVTEDCDPVLRGAKVRTGAERQRYLDAYSAEVEYFDEWLKPVVDALREAGLWDSSIIVFWSDHGEEFWEHGGWAHGQSLYEEQMHIPLVVRTPGQSEGREVKQPVSLLDVMPTVLKLCGIEEAPPGLRGRSLTPLLESEDGSTGEFRVFMEACSSGGIRKALLTERYKLVYDVYHDQFSLYDLEEDPGEQHNIHGSALAPETEAWESDLLEFTETSLSAMAQRHEAGREGVPEGIREGLRDLGYIQ